MVIEGTALKVLIGAILIIGFIFTLEVLAKDLGKHGATFKIAEEDIIEYIEKKLRALSDSGELEKHQQILQSRTKEKIVRPTPVSGLYKAEEDKTFYHDPTYILQENIKDHEGKIIHYAGEQINPLDTVSLTENLLFIDGDDKKQIDYLLHLITSSDKAFKVILINGSPLSLEEELKLPIYFDQAGSITKKLRIERVPSLVEQDERLLKITEIKLGDKE